MARDKKTYQREYMRRRRSANYEKPAIKPSKVVEHFDSILELIAGGMPIVRALRSDAKFPVMSTFIDFARHPERRQRLVAAKLQGKQRRDDRALLFLAQGSVADFDATAKARRLPCSRTLWLRSVNDREFSTRYNVALAKAGQHSRSRGHSSERFTSQLMANDTYRRVASTVPKNLYPEAREDIISDMIEAVLAGRLVNADIASRCAEYVTRHNRQFSVLKMQSLDEHQYDNNESINVLDNITTDPDATSWGI